MRVTVGDLIPELFKFIPHEQGPDLDPEVSKYLK